MHVYAHICIYICICHNCVYRHACMHVCVSLIAFVRQQARRLPLKEAWQAKHTQNKGEHGRKGSSSSTPDTGRMDEDADTCRSQSLGKGANEEVAKTPESTLMDHSHLDAVLGGQAAGPDGVDGRAADGGALSARSWHVLLASAQQIRQVVAL